MLHTQILDFSLHGSLGENTEKRGATLTLKVGGRQSSWLRPRWGEDRAGFSGGRPLSFHFPPLPVSCLLYMFLSLSMASSEFPSALFLSF